MNNTPVRQVRIIIIYCYVSTATRLVRRLPIDWRTANEHDARDGCARGVESLSAQGWGAVGWPAGHWVGVGEWVANRGGGHARGTTRGSRGKARAWRGLALPCFTFSSDDALGDSDRGNCELCLYQTEARPSSLIKGKKWVILQLRYAPLSIPGNMLLCRNYVDNNVAMDSCVYCSCTAERAFYRDANQRVQRYTLKLIDRL